MGEECADSLHEDDGLGLVETVDLGRSSGFCRGLEGFDEGVGVEMVDEWGRFQVRRELAVGVGF